MFISVYYVVGLPLKHHRNEENVIMNFVRSKGLFLFTGAIILPGSAKY